MAYNASGLQIIGQAPGLVSLTNYAVAAYWTNDTAAVVAAANYFNSAAAVLPLGSLIMVQGDLDGTPFQKNYVVSGNTGTVVTVTATA